jgi:hypothetical protein
MKDFNHGISIDVTSFGVTETWQLFVNHTDASVEIKKVNPWAYHAYVTSDGVAGEKNGFQYRKVGTEEWIDVPEEDITSEGGSFTANIKGLEPETDYEVVASCGNDKSQIMDFTTEAATPIPNGSFEYKMDGNRSVEINSKKKVNS